MLHGKLLFIKMDACTRRILNYMDLYHQETLFSLLSCENSSSLSFRKYGIPKNILRRMLCRG